MSPRELTDAEVFGTQPQKEMSDAEVFAAPKELSDADVGIGSNGYIAEARNAVVRGATNTLGSVFQGYGAMQPDLARQRIQQLETTDPQPPADSSPEELAAYRVRRRTTHVGPPVAAERIAANREMANTPAAETGLYKFGSAVSDLVPPSQKVLNPLVEDVLGGFGSVGTNIATSLIPGVGGAATIASTLGQGAGEAAERAVKAGASEPQIAKATSLGTIPGATEFVDALLPKLGTPGKVLGFLRRVGLRVAEGAFIEGGQEGLQEFLQNAIAKGVYDPNQDLLTPSVAYNALVGGIVGGAVSGTIGGHGKDHTPADPIQEGLAREAALKTMTGGSTAPTVTDTSGTVSPQMTAPQASLTATPQLEQPVLSRNNDVRIFGEDKISEGDNRPVIAKEERLYDVNIDGKKGSLIVEPQNNGKHLHIRWIGVEGENGTPNSIGVGGSRAIVEALRQEFPGLETVGGNRNSGARGRETDVVQSIPPVEGQPTTLNIAGQEFPAKWVRSEGQLTKALIQHESPIAVEVSNQRQAVKLKETEQDYHVMTMPVMSDPYSHLRDPSRTAQIFAESQQIQAEFAQHAPQILTVAVNWTPSTSRSISDNTQDLERSQVSGVPVETSPEPTVTVVAMPQSSQMLGSQDVVATGGTQLLPPLNNIRIFQDPKNPDRVVDIQSSHMAYAHDWLDVIQPSAPQNDLNSVVTKAVINRLKQVVPPALQIHLVPQSTLDKLNSKLPKGGVQGSYLHNAYPGSAPNTIAPVVVVNEALRISDPNDFAHTILHEIVHAASSHILLSQDPNIKVEEGNRYSAAITLRTDVRLLMSEAQNQIVRTPSMHEGIATVEYAFKNEEEFLAEAMSNSKFQDLLGRMKAPPTLRRMLKLDGQRPSLWQGFVQAIHRVLGLPYNAESYTMLEATMRIGERVFDVQNRLPHPVDTMSPAFQIGSKPNRIAINVESSNLPVVETQPEIDGARISIGNLFGGWGKVPPKVQQAAAHADQMNWLYKWMGGLSHLTRANPNFTPLVAYKQLTEAMHRDEVRVHDMAVRIGKDWISLGKQGPDLANFIDELAHMSYRSANEVSNGIVRHPSSQEFRALTAKHHLDKRGLELFRRITQMISGDPTKPNSRGFLGLIEDSIIAHIQKTVLLQNQQARIFAVQKQVQELRKRPYFPFTNFGTHYVLVKNRAGDLIHFETVERSGLKSAEAVQKRRMNELARTWRQQHNAAPRLWSPGMQHSQADIVYGKLPDHVGPLIGMPSVLLQHMTAVMELTPEQINAANLLQALQTSGTTPLLDPRYQRKFYVPGYGFDKPGYSADLQRSFARYFFHGAKFYSKAKYLDDMRTVVKEAQLSPGNLEADIAKFMNDHLQHTVLDARGNWGWAKGAIFIWAMGYVPAAATQNLAQTPMITLPFLAAKFGDARAAAALVKAMGRLSSYYKYGTYQSSNQFELKALEYGIRTGRIQETQAPELAGMSQANVLQGLAGNKLERGWTKFMQGSTYMFEAAEQWNRRIAFRAALELATNNPTSKYVDQAMKLHGTEFQQLKAEGFTDAQARAIIGAIDVVDQTQYVYAKWDRARFMRGPLTSTLFVFKRYIQSTTFMLGQNHDVFWRFSLISMLVAGLAGLPGAEDILSLVKGIGAFMGKDWNLERMARKHIIEMFDGKIDPDIVLRGFARRGMGIPWLLDLMGSFATGEPGRGLMSGGAPVMGRDPNTGEQAKQGFAKNIPFPVVDRSRAISMGMLSPVDLGRMMTPASDLDRTIAEQTQKASGAVFSVGFNTYKAIMDNNLAWNDWKRWERAMPRLVGDASESFRAFSEGRERSKGGPAGGTTVVSYDTRDTEQMMEAISIALGYQPLRKQAHWDNVMAKTELYKYYDINRDGILGNFYEAVAGKNEDEIASAREAVKRFNDGLPDWAKSRQITGDMIQKSVEGHFRARALREAGLPSQSTNVPLAQEIDRLYPESVIDVRRAR